MYNYLSRAGIISFILCLLGVRWNIVHGAFMVFRFANIIIFILVLQFPWQSQGQNSEDAPASQHDGAQGWAWDADQDVIGTSVDFIQKDA
jgi:hypothetical protein